MKKENPQTDLDAAALAAPALAPQAVRSAAPIPTADTAHKHVKTQGEKKFDFLTYNVLGYIANALISVVAVYWVERTHSGQGWLNKRIEWVQKNFSKIDPEKARMYTTKSFFLVGGFLVMPPIKWLEDAKVRLVKKWDRQIYGDTVETDPKILQSHKELEAAPKQNWLSILGSRVLALVPFYTLYGMLWDNKSALSRWTNPELRGMSKEAIKAAEAANPAAFSQMANKGMYFDHPISGASRYIGEKIAQLRGKTEIVEQIQAARKEFPGTMTHPSPGQPIHDPNHSVVPYYFISEAITSGVVAWGVYALTRVLGPILGKKAVVQAASVPAVSAPVSPTSQVNAGGANGPMPVAEFAAVMHEQTSQKAAGHQEKNTHGVRHSANVVQENPAHAPHPASHASVKPLHHEAPIAPETKVHAAGIEHHAHEAQPVVAMG